MDKTEHLKSIFGNKDVIIIKKGLQFRGSSVIIAAKYDSERSVREK